MSKLLKEIRDKINGVVWTLATTGVMLLLLAVLVVWLEFMIRLLFGLFILIIAYAFFYLAHRFWTIRRELEKFFKL